MRTWKQDQGVQPWALTKFPDFSLTFPWPFCGFPWPWDILSAFHYCLNTNFASNLTNHSPKLAITKWYQLGRLSKYKIGCFNFHKIACAQWQPSELNTREGQTVLWFLIIFYYLDCTKCKFPDFSQYSFFPWPSTKFPDFSLTFAKSGISLTFPWPLDTLKTDPQYWRIKCHWHIITVPLLLTHMLVHTCRSCLLHRNHQWSQ